MYERASPYRKGRYKPRPPILKRRARYRGERQLRQLDVAIKRSYQNEEAQNWRENRGAGGKKNAR